MLIATAAKFEIPKDRIETWRAVTMGRASQPFNNDGYSPKTIATKPEIIREGWVSKSKPTHVSVGVI